MTDPIAATAKNLTHIDIYMRKVYIENNFQVYISLVIIQVLNSIRIIQREIHDLDATDKNNAEVFNHIIKKIDHNHQFTIKYDYKKLKTIFKPKTIKEKTKKIRENFIQIENSNYILFNLIIMAKERLNNVNGNDSLKKINESYKVIVSVTFNGKDFLATIQQLPWFVVDCPMSKEYDVKELVKLGIESHLKEMKKNNLEIPLELSGDYQLVFQFNVKALLNYYGRILPKSSMSEITGVNESQLWYYSTGARKPRKEQIERISEGFNKFVKNLKYDCVAPV